MDNPISPQPSTRKETCDGKSVRGVVEVEGDDTGVVEAGRDWKMPMQVVSFVLLRVDHEIPLLDSKTCFDNIKM